MFLWSWAFSMYCACDSGHVEDRHGEPGWVYMCYPPVGLLRICSLTEGRAHGCSPGAGACVWEEG